MKFSIRVRGPKGDEWWESYERQIGESHYVPNHGRQPEFNGDIFAFGKALIDWFNKHEPVDKHRTFVDAVIGDKTP